MLEKTKFEKPPIGLIPKYIHIEERINSIKDAVNRYFDVNLPINPEWIEEYNDLVKQYESNNSRK